MCAVKKIIVARLFRSLPFFHLATTGLLHTWRSWRMAAVWKEKGSKRNFNHFPKFPKKCLLGSLVPKSVEVFPDWHWVQFKLFMFHEMIYWLIKWRRIPSKASSGVLRYLKENDYTDKAEAFLISFISNNKMLFFICFIKHLLFVYCFLQSCPIQE